MTTPIGKTWDAGTHLVEREHALAYAAATGDTAPVYMQGLCPPMFHVRLMHRLIFQIATDPELGLDLLRLVHGEHDATFHAPILHGERVRTTGELISVEQKSSGLTVTSALRGYVGEDLRVSCRTVYFVRGDSPAAPKPPASDAKPEPKPDWVLPVNVAPDQSWVYARASLDDNPIHVDPEVARRVGLPDVIVQGLCTMALSGAAIVRAKFDNDPRRLGRLAVRFSKPVLNGQELRVELSGQAFATKNDRGQAVLANGRFAER